MIKERTCVASGLVFIKSFRFIHAAHLFRAIDSVKKNGAHLIATKGAKFFNSYDLRKNPF